MRVLPPHIKVTAVGVVEEYATRCAAADADEERDGLVERVDVRRAVERLPGPHHHRSTPLVQRAGLFPEPEETFPLPHLLVAAHMRVLPGAGKALPVCVEYLPVPVAKDEAERRLFDPDVEGSGA